MYKLSIIFSFLIVFSCKNYGQEMTCADFKNGTFVFPTTELMTYSYTIIREGNTQIEISRDSKDPLNKDLNKTSYGIVEWINDCTYRVKYDETKMELDEYGKFINENNGIMTEIIRIEDNCFYFKTTFVIEGVIQNREGKLCAK